MLVSDHHLFLERVFEIVFLSVFSVLGEEVCGSFFEHNTRMRENGDVFKEMREGKVRERKTCLGRE